MFCAAIQVGASGRVVGVDFTDEQIEKARHLRDRDGFPRDSYLGALEAAGFRVNEVRTNDYDFISERALDACSTYGVESISFAAVKDA